MAVAPNGSFLYVANPSGTVSAYAIGSGGLLTPLSTPTVAAGLSPTEIAITPNGAFLYVTDFATKSVFAFAIGSNGLLTPLSVPYFTAGTSPSGVVVVP
jgi:DNA-binding beta-propeller fold protein YncE